MGFAHKGTVTAELDEYKLLYRVSVRIKRFALEFLKFNDGGKCLCGFAHVALGFTVLSFKHCFHPFD